MLCSLFGSVLELLGVLGRLAHYRCRGRGMVFSCPNDSREPVTIDDSERC